MTLVCLTGRDALSNLWHRWTYEEEYGYGVVVVALVPLFLWRRWHLIQATSTGTKWPGLALVIVAQLCTVLAASAESYFIEQAAFLLSLLGIGLVVFGTGPIRVFLPLTAILLLTIPLPYTLQAIITIKLQLISTNLGVAAIELIGVPVFAEGNIIDLGTYKLQVVEACSGLRYLLPLTCISFILGHLYKAPFWKRAVIVASALPITVLINSFRIALVAVLVDHLGTRMADGFLHQFEGWVVFLIGILLLGFEIIVLERFRWSRINIESIMDRPVTSGDIFPPMKIGGSAVFAALVCAVALVATNSVTSALEAAPRPARESFAEFPRKIDGWTGQQTQLEPAIVDTLLKPVVHQELLLALLDDGAAIHSPRVCLPGTGWEFASLEQRLFDELTAGMSGTYSRAVIQKGEQKLLMYYWFQQRERRTASEFSMKYYLLVDSLSKSRSDGALVRIYTPITGENGEAQAEARLLGFAKDVLPRVNGYLPR